MYYVRYTPPKSFVIPSKRNVTYTSSWLAPEELLVPIIDLNHKAIDPAKEEDIKDWWEQNSD